MFSCSPYRYNTYPCTGFPKLVWSKLYVLGAGKMAQKVRAHYSCKEPIFSCKYPHSVSQLLVILIPGDLTFSFNVQGTMYTHGIQTYM